MPSYSCQALQIECLALKIKTLKSCEMFGTTCVCAAAQHCVPEVLNLRNSSSAYNILHKNALWAEGRIFCVKPGST